MGKCIKMLKFLYLKKNGKRKINVYIIIEVI